ncbi:protein HAPLESS 2-like isoform X3 [Silene latifolia]|uniref:protein HAPLESS 2-like isoform X3 n=1 Tax=Silene latifolia TaxID=37657 RepID=UPI003D77AEAC
MVGRFERINDHPDAGPRYFSIGITEVLNANLLIELGADDIEYVNQRSPGKILGITVLTFEALAQFGIAKIEIKNVGEVEPSYSLTFQCSEGVMMSEEQFFIMKPEEVVTRFCKVDPTTDQAAKYACSGKAICSSFFLFCVCLNGNLGHSQNLIFCKLIIVPVTTILKDSEFKEVDRAECQFTTTATVLDNGTLVCTVTCDGNHILKDPPFNRHSSNQLKAFGTNSGLVCQSSSWENLAGSLYQWSLHVSMHGESSLCLDTIGISWFKRR